MAILIYYSKYYIKARENGSTRLTTSNLGPITDDVYPEEFEGACPACPVPNLFWYGEFTERPCPERSEGLEPCFIKNQAREWA